MLIVQCYYLRPVHKKYKTKIQMLCELFVQIIKDMIMQKEAQITWLPVNIQWQQQLPVEV